MFLMLFHTDTPVKMNKMESEKEGPLKKTYFCNTIYFQFDLKTSVYSKNELCL